MKLLILTQKVDKNDDVLGFFHDWLLEFAKKCEKLTVICLEKGEYDLHENTRVFSLGKEKKVSKFEYLKKFFKYIWNERKNYEKVFVHMNPEYMVLGGLFWRYWGKKIFFWYNHKKGGLKARIAIWFAGTVFYTSHFAFSAKSHKSKIMPAGINTRLFVPKKSVSKREKTILSLGRISPVKNLDVLIRALKLLDKDKIKFEARIYGDSLKRDNEYYAKLKEKSISLEEGGRLSFHKSVSNYKAPEIYNESRVFVNLTQSGSFDKTILEAMACGNIVLVSNKSFKGVLSEQFLFKKNNPKDLAKKLKNILKLPISGLEKHSETFRQYVIKNHDIKILMTEIKKQID